MPMPDPLPWDKIDAAWDLAAQLHRPHAPQALPPLPPKWGKRRPGDHDWSGPGGTCASCPAPNFLDTTGPCTWGGA